MNWAQFKDPVSHMCLAGAVVACWFVAQEVVGSHTFIAKIFFKFYGFCRFYSIHLGKTLLGLRVIPFPLRLLTENTSWHQTKHIYE